MEINRKLKLIPGVYKIINTVTGKPYIGSTNDFYERLNDGHLRELRLGIHGNGHLQNSWNLYGEDSFIYEIVEVVDFIKDEVELDNFLIELEQHYFDIELFAQEYIRGEDKRFEELGYNLSPTAGKTTGFRFSPEQIEVQSKITTELWKDPVFRENVMKNRKYIREPHKESTKELISKKAKERFEEPERREFYSNLLKNPIYRQNIDEGHKKYFQSDEAKKRFQSEEYREEKRKGTLKNWKNPEFNEKRLKTWNETKSDPNYQWPTCKTIQVTKPTGEILTFKSKKLCQEWIFETFGHKPDITGDYILKNRPYKDHYFRYM